MNPSKLLGIVTCVGMIGYGAYFLVDPVGYSRRFKLPVQTDHPGVIRGLRVMAILMMAGAGYLLLEFLGWIR